MTVDESIEAVAAEVERVFGEEPGFEGTDEQYAWLARVYGITEEEDIKWQYVLEWFRLYGPDGTDLDGEDEDDEEMIAFLEDADAVEAFLAGLLTRYRSSDEAWSRPAC